MLPFVFAEYQPPEYTEDYEEEVTLLEVLESLGLEVPIVREMDRTSKSVQTNAQRADASTQTDRPNMLWSYFV